MATERQKKRRELREKRLKAEAQAKGQDQKQNLTKILAAVGFLVAIGVVVAVVLIVTGGSGSDQAKSNSEIDQLLKGIPQKGTVLGDPKAPVTLVEFGDLQCPACRQFADEQTPKLIKGPVRKGEAMFDFKVWPILGPDSNTAAKAALAASVQGRFWEYIENFYANQGIENTGYVTPEFLKDIAEKAGVPDIGKWEEDQSDPKWDTVISDHDAQAVDLNFSGTPSFAIDKGDGKLIPVEGETIDALISNINKAIKQAQ